MGLASVIVLGVLGFVVLTIVSGIIDAEWEQRQRHKNDLTDRSDDLDK